MTQFNRTVVVNVRGDTAEEMELKALAKGKIFFPNDRDLEIGAYEAKSTSIRPPEFYADIPVREITEGSPE